jgi:hypothetical protein
VDYSFIISKKSELLVYWCTKPKETKKGDILVKGIRIYPSAENLFRVTRCQRKEVSRMESKIVHTQWQANIGD